MNWRLLSRRRGTAEVIGTLFFVLIIMIVLSNIIWYNKASLEMNKHYSLKANSPVSLSTNNGQILRVSATGAYEVEMIGLWIYEENTKTHHFISSNSFVASSRFIPAGGHINVDVSYYSNSFSGKVTYKIITKLGNIDTASYTY